MGQIKFFFKTYWLAILSGVFIGLTYIPFKPWLLPVCYVPLLLFCLRQDSLKKVFWGAWITQFVLTLIGFHWIAVVAEEYGHLPMAAALFVTLLFAAFMHLYIPAAVTTALWLRKKFTLGIPSTLIGFSCLMILGEIYWPVIFPWNLGYPLMWIQGGLVQWADVIGLFGLSFCAYLVNSAVALAFVEKFSRRSKAILVASLILVVTFELLGHSRKEFWANTDATKKVMVVQANIGNLEKFYAERGAGFQQFIADSYFQLTRTGLAVHPDTELIVWPESAFPDHLNPFAYNHKYTKQLLDFSSEIKKPILTGGYSKDPPEQSKRRDYNAVFLLNPSPLPSPDPYHKTYLLIFGEYIPYGDKFEWLAKINPGGAGFGRGSGPTVFQEGDSKIGIQICYESLYPEFSAQLSKKGADFMVNVTNDSWFSSSLPNSWFRTSFEAHQHMIMTLARAVETRRPLVRSTNTGISTVVLADGSVLEKSPTQAAWFKQYAVKYRTKAPQSFYTLFGAWLPAVVLLILFLVLILSQTKGKRRARTQSS
jgi:apolipoprotein N-acyltransferase